jgi:hypothetical protein
MASRSNHTGTYEAVISTPADSGVCLGLAVAISMVCVLSPAAVEPAAGDGCPCLSFSVVHVLHLGLPSSWSL